jgi:hypothetical protein
VAIEERNKSAGVVDPGSTDDEGADASTRSLMSLDDLRLRLDSPLFAREPGLAAAASMPHLRELTWEHVVNPTSSQPLVPADVESPSVRPAPIRVEDLLARPEPALAPLPERADAPPARESGSTAPAPLPTSTPPSGAPWTPAAPGPITTSTPATALPSFAAMLSGEVATTAPWSSDRLDADDLVKPIEEPPPVARDTDPEVNDLAALILRSTPTGATPEVPPASIAAQQISPPVVVPQPVAPLGASVAPAPVDPQWTVAAVVEPVVEAEIPHPPVHSMMSPPLVRDTGVTPVVPGSPVEAELNRLAYVPDLDEDPDGPVEVPAIAYSDLRGAEPVAAAPSMAGSPQLSQSEMFMPRQVAQVHRHAYTDLVTQTAPMPRRRKRHVFRKFVTTIVLLGMVAGGLFAVKHYLLDRVNWPKDVAPLANAVESERGLHFTKDIPVTTLQVADYSVKIAASLGGLTVDATPRIESTWRALGLTSGTLNVGATGLAAAVDSPAFYDPAAKQIYVLADLEPQLRSFALHRALTMALLDQQFKWSSQLTQAAPAVVLGTRAVFDADAIAVALRLISDRDRVVLPDQQRALAAANNVAANDPSPFATATVGRIGLPLWPYLDSLGPDERNALEQSGVMTDSHAFDLRRLTAGATDSVGTTTQGMLFWYHVLASRVDDDLAWKAALGWRGDDVKVDTTGTTTCVNATVTIDAAAAQAATFAFTAWAATAPMESTTSMTPGAGAAGQATFTVHACDPGAAVPANDGKPTLGFGGAPLRVQQFVELVSAKRSMAAAQAACVVYTDDPITIDDERTLFDPATGWMAPSKHPAPDPAAPACASLAGAAPASTPPANADGTAVVAPTVAVGQTP